MKKFKFWKILISVVLVCVLAFSLIACNPPEEPDDGDQTTTSWLNAKTEALNLILGSAVTEFTNGFSQIKEKVINIDFSANWTNNPTDATETKENYTIVLKGNIDITGGQNTSLMFEIVNNSLADNKLVFGAYYNDGENENDLFLILKNDQSLTGTIFGDQPYITGRIDFASVAAIANLVTDNTATTESTNDTSSLDIDVIIAAIAGFCKDPVGADPNSTVNPYITTNSDGSKDVKITIDLESVMNMVKTMGGALLGFISPTVDGKNVYSSLKEYFQEAGIYIQVGKGQWDALSNNNLPSCAGVDVVLSAKIGSDSDLQNLAVEFINSAETFDIVLGVPMEKDNVNDEILSCKELVKFHFTKGSAKLLFDKIDINASFNQSVDAEIQSKITSLISKYADTMAVSNNMLSLTMKGNVQRYNSSSEINTAEIYTYELKVDIDIMGALMAGLEYAFDPLNKVVKTDGMTDAEYKEKCAVLWEGIVNEVMTYLKNGGVDGKGLIEFVLKDSEGNIDSYLYFNAKDINIENKEAIIEFYTTDGEIKTKAEINIYDLTDYAIEAAFRSYEKKSAKQADYKDILFNALKTITTVWGSINFIDSDNDGVIDYTEINKDFKEALYTLFGASDPTKDSFDRILSILFAGYQKMAISIENITFGNVQYTEKLVPVGFEGEFGEYETAYSNVPEIRLGGVFTLSTGEKVKIMDYLVTEKNDKGAITEVKIITWKCNQEGTITSAGGIAVLTLTGDNIQIYGVDGITIIE